MGDPAIHEAFGVTTVKIKAAVADVSPGNLLGYNAGWVKADADARIPALFVAMEFGRAGDLIHVCRSGRLIDTDDPFTAGVAMFLSATAGAYTATAPAISATLTVLQRIGFAVSVSEMRFDLQNTGPYILRAAVAHDAASLAAVTAVSTAVALTGVLADDVARPGPHSLLTGTGYDSGLMAQNITVSAVDEITIRKVNASAVALDGVNETFDVYLERWAVGP